jgi:hypothetical protein
VSLLVAKSWIGVGRSTLSRALKEAEIATPERGRDVA